MRSSFYGLEIARTGLFIAQKQLNVTGHNIANVETKGYSRQRLDTAAIDPLTGPTKYYIPDYGRIGGGVQSMKTTQIRDYFLDRQYRDQSSTTGQWSVRAAAMDYIDLLFDETNESTKLGNAINKFFGSLSALSNDFTESSGVRAALSSSAVTLNEYFHIKYQKLYEEMQHQDKMIEASVSTINSIANSIAVLNEKIFSYEFDGKEYANDLRDKRNKLVDELSQLVKIEYGEEVVDGDPLKIHFWVSFGDDPSHRLVDHMIVDPLVAEKGALNGLVSLEVDNLSRQIASYNTSISGNLLSPEAKDAAIVERAKLVYQLAQYIESLGGTAVVEYEGSDVPIGDILDTLSDPSADSVDLVIRIDNVSDPLVNEGSYTPLGNTDADITKLAGAYDMTKLSWASDGGDVSITDGKLFGNLVMRDGGDSVSNGLPYYIFQLNEYVRSLSGQFNRVHEQGYTLPYTANGIDFDSQTGISFFVSKNGGPITAANIIVNPIITDTTQGGSVNNIALSSEQVRYVLDGDDSNTNHGNNLIGQELYRLLDKVVGSDGALLDNLWTNFIADIGTSANYALSAYDTHQRVEDNLQNQRLSVMAVSIDEEMTNMIRFNHAYGAASRVITAMDEALDRLINGTGRVGL